MQTIKENISLIHNSIAKKEKLVRMKKIKFLSAYNWKKNSNIFTYLDVTTRKGVIKN